mmetsp:Transcript_53306/g.134233  ORF Transcript_53306/g.134233 Transcript_53306/m.134233 type:complete len:117 (-) Transcript_53306:363-713(-)
MPAEGGVGKSGRPSVHDCSRRVAKLPPRPNRQPLTASQPAANTPTDRHPHSRAHTCRAATQTAVPRSAVPCHFGSLTTAPSLHTHITRQTDRHTCIPLEVRMDDGHTRMEAESHDR